MFVLELYLWFQTGVSKWDIFPFYKGMFTTVTSECNTFSLTHVCVLIIIVLDEQQQYRRWCELTFGNSIPDKKWHA
jgi:hypothetical protein